MIKKEMSDADLAAVRALAEGATPDDKHVQRHRYAHGGGRMYRESGEGDREFYFAARTLVPRLCDTVEEAQGAAILNAAALKNALARAETAERERDEARARVEKLEALQKIARVQVDDAGDLWLHLDGGGRYKASFNVTAKLTHPTGVLTGGVREATKAIRALLAPAPCATCATLEFHTYSVKHRYPDSYTAVHAVVPQLPRGGWDSRSERPNVPGWRWLQVGEYSVPGDLMCDSRDDPCVIACAGPPITKNHHPVLRRVTRDPCPACAPEVPHA